jgi:hypothetical protein
MRAGNGLPIFGGSGESGLREFDGALNLAAVLVAPARPAQVGHVREGIGQKGRGLAFQGLRVGRRGESRAACHRTSLSPPDHEVDGFAVGSTGIEPDHVLIDGVVPAPLIVFIPHPGGEVEQR